MSPLPAVKFARLILSSHWKTRRCTSVGRRVRVQGGLSAVNSGTIPPGDRVRVRGMPMPIELAALPGGTLEIGERTYINAGTSIAAQTSVKTGARCAIGNLTLIMDTDFHSTHDHTVAPEPRPVIIEDDV